MSRVQGVIGQAPLIFSKERQSVKIFFEMVGLALVLRIVAIVMLQLFYWRAQ